MTQLTPQFVFKLKDGVQEMHIGNTFMCRSNTEDRLKKKMNYVMDNTIIQSSNTQQIQTKLIVDAIFIYDIFIQMSINSILKHTRPNSNKTGLFFTKVSLKLAWQGPFGVP